jgi:hypothetical protein
METKTRKGCPFRVSPCWPLLPKIKPILKQIEEKKLAAGTDIVQRNCSIQLCYHSFSSAKRDKMTA